MRPIPITYIINELDVGGAEQALYRLASRIDHRRFCPHVVCLHGRGAIGRWLAEKQVPVTYLGLSSGYDVRVFARLRRLLAGRAKVVHTLLFEANFLGRIAARLAQVPIVISSLRVAERRRRDLRLDRWTISLVDVETCVSEGVRQAAIRYAGVPPAKLVTIHNGVDISGFTADRKASRARLQLPEEVPVVLSIGRLHEQKGFEYLIRATKTIREKFPAVQVLIAGIGPLENKLRQLVDKLGLQENVHLLGFREDVPRLLAAADLFVLPSLWEGLANVILEASAAGKPVVATQVEGSAEIIEDGRTGILIPPADSQALVQGITTILSNPQLGKLIGKRGLSLVKEHFSIAKMVKQHEKLYQNLLSLKRIPLG